MGATEFFTHIKDHGKPATAAEAFEVAVYSALYDHGHSGYSGTIAEKHNFDVIESAPTPMLRARAIAEKMVEDGDERIDDKWGPAGAIRTENGWLFFGWASD
jgi:hypothetical protein